LTNFLGKSSARKLDAPGWVACKELLIDEPFGKTAQNGFDALTMADALSCEFSEQLGLHGSLGQISERVKGWLMPWSRSEPGQKLLENKRIGPPRGFSLQSQHPGLVAANPGDDLIRFSSSLLVHSAHCSALFLFSSQFFGLILTV
jgi:hypothetical protein